MRERLRALYLACSGRSGITPRQSAVLAESSLVLRSPRVSDQVIRATIEDLEAAFENRSRRPLIHLRPTFSGFILDFSRP
jgi:hypothetical protein